VGVASVRVAEILRAAWAESPDGTRLPSSLAAACVRSLPVSGVGLALMTDQGPAGIITATDGPALELEALQLAFGEGPCVDASNTGRSAEVFVELADTLVEGSLHHGDFQSAGGWD
jgi:hypothetical protein